MGNAVCVWGLISCENCYRWFVECPKSGGSSYNAGLFPMRTGFAIVTVSCKGESDGVQRFDGQ